MNFSRTIQVKKNNIRNILIDKFLLITLINKIFYLGYFRQACET